ncbi:hypothetical protein RMSM_01078 [Rhodopirellula maiorica SM1]|uniref:Pvc16 N-terminal domain-containing protein n=1 Tax=Rhodopirellula maiorica SM1 TaxID=1265738 RepID=M5RS18_9BACT|nr:DUF4255 domain-containing protein [Rhodopirellula maiorica]EMI22001.1 hypothetical protein RMSM_01078 [Rhodopirellula maiorica SM1]
MSNSLAIAAVTRSIQLMLQTYAKVDCTTKSPDKAAGDGEGARVNLFLYHTMPNPTWRNLDIPGRVGRGEKGNPPLALNLYYLLTAYGEDGANLADQRTLGQAMQVLHDRPVIKRADVKSFLPADLLASGLDEQLEHIRIVPDTLNIEEMSRLWTTFQTQYRVSAAYQAAVVLIESDRPTPSALPVAKRGKDDRGARTDVGIDPVLQGIEYRGDPQQPALPAANVGSKITIVGSNLPAVGLSVVVRDLKQELNGSVDDNVVATLEPTVEVAGSRLVAQLSEGLGVWPAGMLSLEVAFNKGDQVVTSNSVHLALAAEIQTSAAQESAIAFVDETQGTLAVSLKHPLGQDRRVMLILNRYEAPDDEAPSPPPKPNSFFQIPQLPDDTGIGNLNPTFDVSKVPPGTYWIRIRVDGIDSMLMTGTQDPETKRWSVDLDNNQKVTI